MMHSFTVPPIACGTENRACGVLFFTVGRPCQVCDFEGSNLSPIARVAVLCESNEAAIVSYHSPSGSGDSRIALYYWASRVLMPAIREAIRIVETKRIALLNRRAGKHPPHGIKAEDGCVGAPSGQERPHARPAGWKKRRPIQADSVHRQGLRNHVVVIFPPEDVRVGEVKGFPEHDLAVFPM